MSTVVPLLLFCIYSLYSHLVPLPSIGERMQKERMLPINSSRSLSHAYAVPGTYTYFVPKTKIHKLLQCTLSLLILYIQFHQIISYFDSRASKKWFTVIKVEWKSMHWFGFNFWTTKYISTIIVFPKINIVNLSLKYLRYEISNLYV